jgi:plasmid replication initiation protein
MSQNQEYVIYNNDDLSELQVSISHAITRASHSLTLAEKRIVGLFIAKLDRSNYQKVSVTNRIISLSDATIRITAKEYSDTFGVNSKNAYSELVKASDKFFNRYWRIIEDTQKGPKERKFRWLEGVFYHHGEGWMEATFGQTTIPHLIFNFGDKYTRYKLKATASLKGSYSWRFWELLAQFGNTKKPSNEVRIVRLTLEEFMFAMESPKSYKFPQIKQKIIEPSIKQIKDKNKIDVQWRPIKKGRAVYSVEFSFTPNEQISLF